MKVATWRFPAGKIVPAGPVQARMLEIDLSGHPELVDHLADWTPVSHQILIVEDDVVLTVLLHREVTTPDDLAEI